MNTCLNCSSDNQSDSKFCRNCGQQLDEKLSMKILFRATIANYFSVDSSLKKSIGPVLFKPGKIAKEFVNGKRTAYIHPAKFYLFSSFIFFIVLGLVSKIIDENPIDFKTTTNFEKETSELLVDSVNEGFNKNGRDIKIDTLKVDAENLQNLLDSLNITDESLVSDDKIVNDFSLAIDSSLLDANKSLGSKFIKGLLKLEKEGTSGVFSKMISNLPYALILSVPLFALFLLLILFRQPQGYASHLVFSLYYFSFSFFVWTGFFSLDYFIDFHFLIGLSVFILIWWYLCKGIKRFYNLSWKKSILISIIQSIFYILLIFVMVILLGVIAVTFS